MQGYHRFRLKNKDDQKKTTFVGTSALRRKFLTGGAKFRHNRVTSQINFRGSAEGTTGF